MRPPDPSWSRPVFVLQGTPRTTHGPEPGDALTRPCSDWVSIRAFRFWFPALKTLLLSVVALLCLVACCPGEQVDERGWPTELVLGLVPALEADALVDNLDPLADYLAEELGIPVTSFVPQDYTGLVEALGAGRADIGMLPPFAAMLGQRRYDLEPILISTRRGETGYRTQWMTNDTSVCREPPVVVERCASRGSSAGRM